MNIGLQVLKAKLRGFHLAGATYSRRISRAEKERKHRLWEAKRRLGSHCRNHLIAYSLLRGTPYSAIEQCAPNNRPNPHVILEIMLQHATWDQNKDLDLSRVEKLLT
jgi:hypothetical protein